MSPACSTAFQFRYPTPTAASLIEQAIRVELGELAVERSTVSVDRREEVVRIDIEARDLVALRAATNSWLRYLQTAESVAAAVEQHADPS